MEAGRENSADGTEIAKIEAAVAIAIGQMTLIYLAVGLL
jgi:hypothetical protein